MIFETWKMRFEALKKACEHVGAEIVAFNIENPATEAEVNELEQKLGEKLPQSLRKVLTEFSSKVDIYWSLPDDFKLPHELSEIFAGECIWGIEEILNAEERRKSWVKNVFSNPNDDYDKVWHNKLGFVEVGNGDCIAFDLSIPDDPPIIYLSHDDGEGHGYKLGDNFIDFIDRYLQVGCTGSEEWQMIPFISSPSSGIEPNCENARKWREIFGLKI